MSARTLGALAIIVFTWATSASAQLYPSTPVPRSTAPAALHDAAVDRAIRERFALGLAALSNGKNEDAAAEFTAVLALRPREPQGSTAHYDLALAQVALGRLDVAASEFRSAIALDPGFLAAMANLIAVDLRRGDLREARTVGERFVTLAPDSARALYSRGVVALQAGDAARAADDFGRLVANNPSYALAHVELAKAELQLNDPARAERESLEALRLAPNYAYARFVLGTILLHEGRRDEARNAFDRAARDAAGDAQLQNLAYSMRDAIGH